MKKHNIVVTQEAKNDIDSIVAYVAMENKKAALNFAKIILKNFIYLSEYPNMGKRRYDLTDEDVLFFTIKWGYRIIYQVKNQNLYILRILSGYQDTNFYLSK